MNSNVSLSLSLSFENSRIFSIYSIYRQIVDFFSAGTNGGGKKKKKEKRERGTASIGSQRDAFNEKKC